MDGYGAESGTCGEDFPGHDNVPRVPPDGRSTRGLGAELQPDAHTAQAERDSLPGRSPLFRALLAVGAAALIIIAVVALTQTHHSGAGSYRGPLGSNPKGPGFTSGTGNSGNTGTGNTGAGNSGAGNTGAGNTGAGNTGAGNTGAGNTGAGVSGAGVSGAGVSGAGVSGAGVSGAGVSGAGVSGAGSGNTATGNTGSGPSGAGAVPGGASGGGAGSSP